MRILIEPTAIMHVLGTKMDFVEDRLKCARLSMCHACSQHITLAVRVAICCSMSTPEKCLPGMLRFPGSVLQPAHALQCAVPYVLT